MIKQTHPYRHAPHLRLTPSSRSDEAHNELVVNGWRRYSSGIAGTADGATIRTWTRQPRRLGRFRRRQFLVEIVNAGDPR